MKELVYDSGNAKVRIRVRNDATLTAQFTGEDPADWTGQWAQLVALGAEPRLDKPRKQKKAAAGGVLAVLWTTHAERARIEVMYPNGTRSILDEQESLNWVERGLNAALHEAVSRLGGTGASA